MGGKRLRLLDTSTPLWALTDSDRLSPAATEAIEKGEPLLSVASWVLPIRASHITALAALPDLHRDPFGRVLIAHSVLW